MTAKGDETRKHAEIILAGLRKAEDPASPAGGDFADAVLMAAVCYACEAIGEPATVERLRDRADLTERGLLWAVARGHDFGNQA